MGRRALRQVDPRIDLSRYLFLAKDLPAGWDVGWFFPSAAPLEIEIGSGKGLFLSTEPLARPDHRFIGIEIAARYARFTAARLARRGLTNACVISGDATPIFHERLPTSSIAAVHIYFPDPWWKKRHHKRRIMRADFLQQIDRVLQPGGRLHFWTDVAEYFSDALQVIAQTVPWRGPIPVLPRQADHDLDYRTHFERRMRLHDHPVHRAEFEK
jgi:tRNA (guanine-N7-)-methyltransferase